MQRIFGPRVDSSIVFFLMISLSFISLFFLSVLTGTERMIDSAGSTLFPDLSESSEQAETRDDQHKNYSPSHNENQLMSSQAKKSKEELIIWTSDFHISTVYDIKHILQAQFPQLLNGVRIKIIDKSLSGHCHLTNTCQTDLHILTKENGIDLSPCPNRLRARFYQYYKHDSEFQSVDAFLCTHASSMCELYLPFGKPIIVVASTRFEIGRHDPVRWQNWITNLQKIASRKENTVAANNEYDREYIKYFTGLPSEQVLLLRSLCGYPNVTYLPIRPEILIGPSRGIDSQIAQKIMSFTSHQTLRYENQPMEIRLLRDVYPHYEYLDLSHHPAVILLPYQVSFMLFFELYSMAIPMYVPSPDLLTEWHLALGILSERTWDRVFGHPRNSSLLPRHPFWKDHSQGSSEKHFNSDPNSEFSFEAIREWIQFADFYRLPHVIQFNSLSHLESLLSSHSLSKELNEISRKMRRYQEDERLPEVRTGWKNVISRIYHHQEKRENGGRVVGDALEGEKNLKGNPLTKLNEALRAEYDVEVSGDNCIDQRTG
jgi:hypothetical protein